MKLKKYNHADGFLRIMLVALSKSNGEELREITLKVDITNYF